MILVLFHEGEAPFYWGDGCFWSETLPGRPGPQMTQVKLSGVMCAAGGMLSMLTLNPHAAYRYFSV
jgi:hypothetical protein